MYRKVRDRDFKGLQRSVIYRLSRGVDLNHDDAALPAHKRPGCVPIYHLKCYFKQRIHNSWRANSLSDQWMWFLLLFAAFIYSMETTDMLSYLVCKSASALNPHGNIAFSILLTAWIRFMVNCSIAKLSVKISKGQYAARRSLWGKEHLTGRSRSPTRSGGILISLKVIKRPDTKQTNDSTPNINYFIDLKMIVYLPLSKKYSVPRCTKIQGFYCHVYIATV